MNSYRETIGTLRGKISYVNYNYYVTIVLFHRRATQTSLHLLEIQQWTLLYKMPNNDHDNLDSPITSQHDYHQRNKYTVNYKIRHFSFRPKFRKAS